jgi:hypothetical protein
MDTSSQINMLQSRIRQNEQRIGVLRCEIGRIETVIQGLCDAKSGNWHRQSEFQGKVTRERGRLSHVLSAAELRVAQGYARHVGEDISGNRVRVIEAHFDGICRSLDKGLTVCDERVGIRKREIDELVRANERYRSQIKQLSLGG